jgi:hypothetical protein
MARFSRRHAQRQALSYGQSEETHPLGLPSNEGSQWHKALAIKPNERSASSNDHDSDSESSADCDEDFGCDSTANTNAKAEYYRQKKAQFVADSLTLSNPCDSTKDMIRVAERK